MTVERRDQFFAEISIDGQRIAPIRGLASQKAFLLGNGGHGETQLWRKSWRRRTGRRPSQTLKDLVNQVGAVCRNQDSDRDSSLRAYYRAWGMVA